MKEDLMDIVVRYENVEKIYYKGRTQLRDVLLFRPRKTFHIIKNMSFSVCRGDRLAIIGGNGAGKSTLLKLLSRITPPSRGKIIVNGTLATLLEVGAGFHQELTGIQNIYLNGSVLGLSRQTIKQNLHRIVDFAEINPTYMDLPLSFFSSGMKARLGFSIAQFVDTDILILDETLSVGDISFRRKASDAIRSMFSSGRTIIFVSHDLHSIAELSNKVLWIEQGELQDFGTTEEILPKYLEYHGIYDESLSKRFLDASPKDRIVYENIQDLAP